MNVRAEYFLRGTVGFRTQPLNVYLTHGTAKLAHSKYGHYEEIKNMVEVFERSTKLTFKDASNKCHIKFGSMGDHDSAVGIRMGQLVLEGFVAIS